MRSIVSTCFLLALLLDYGLSAVVQPDIHKRDAVTSTTGSGPSAASPSSTPSGNDGGSSMAASPSSVSGDASARGTQSSVTSAASSTLVSITSSSVSPASPTSSTTNTTVASDADDALPLPPAITPALSIAGAFLMISGLVYGLVGIKNKWLQIYISTAYLVALAITVLIIYVINPPISLAIQGAYFIGAFIPALGIGGLALIFKDVTEGLGCAVGGFCLSMFFLILKPGGLLPGNAAKAIFIGCWTVGIYALSFSHYVRSYALIGATSLGGATAVIIGIDCFSLAGLKEFWIYIWGLNDKLFPLLNDTYPITRGIRVEIAGMVILTFVGVLSQMRIWKVVRERRQRNETERLEANRERDELEAELGRRLEDSNAHEREQWEGKDGKSINGSGTGTSASSTRKISTSVESKGVRDSTVETIELDPLPASSALSEPVSKTDTDGHEEGKSIQVDTKEVVPTPTSDRESRTLTSNGPANDFLEGQEALMSNNKPSERITDAAKKPAYSGPTIVPLPFNVPTNNNEDDAASIATYASSRRESRRFSHRFSGSYLSRKLSQRSDRLSMQSSTSLEALTDGVSRDMRSLDSQSGSQVSEVTDRAEDSIRPERKDLHDVQFFFEAPAQETLHPSSLERSSDTVGTPVLHSTEPSSEVLAAPSNMASRTEDELNKPATNTTLLGTSAPADAVAHISSVRLDDQEQLPGNDEASKEEEPVVGTPHSPSRNLSEILPAENASKIVMQYRTNEWAKHLEKADEPEFDNMDSVGPIVEEPSTILNAEQLLQTPLTAEISPALTSFETRRISTSRSSSTGVRGPTRVPSFSVEDTTLSPKARASLNNVPRSSSRNSMRKQSRVSSFHNDPNRSSPRPHLSTKRSSSTPLATSTIDEDAEFTFSPVPSPLPTDTLMAHRNTMLRNKSLTGSSRPVSSSIYPSTPSEGSSSPGLSQNSSFTSLNPQDDNAPLSSRRAYIQRTSSTQSFQSAISQRPTPSPSPSQQQLRLQQPLSRSPSTDPTLRRESMLAAWRSSLNQDMAAARAPEQEVQARREEMWQERAQERSRRESENVKAKKGGWRRESTGMGAKEMNDAHREVLRRMQAGANKALGGGT